MSADVSPQTQRLAEILEWIEHRLDQPLTLDAIAVQAQLSAYHFSRLFTARMGRSVMAHVRGRRLVKAAQRLSAQPDLRLVDLAFDCGFESQEAFTRAFGRVFGVAPGRFRQGFAVAPIEGQFPMTVPAIPAATVSPIAGTTLVERFVVAGPARRFDDADKADIPQLWSRLIGALPLPRQVPGFTTYGVVSAVNRSEGSFDYMAGVQVADADGLGAGFSSIVVPRSHYAVFKITLQGGPLHPQIKAAMAHIWGELIPASGLEVGDGPDFERYDSEFDPTRPGAIIDFYVPVVVSSPESRSPAADTAHSGRA